MNGFSRLYYRAMGWFWSCIARRFNSLSAEATARADRCLIKARPPQRF